MVKINLKTKVDEEVKSSLPIEEVNNPNGVYTVKNLPSEFKLYPNGVDTKITYKGYTWGQERKLSSSDLTTRQLWELILEGIEIADRSISKTKLTVADFHYIAYLRKAGTLGFQDFNVKINCYNIEEETNKICSHQNNLTIKNTRSDSEIEFSNMTLTKEEFPVILETDDFSIELSPMTVSDAFVLMNKNLWNDDIARLAVQVTNMSFDEAYKLFLSDKFTPEIGREVERIDELFYHRLTPISKKCEKCGKELMVVLDSGGTFIYPFRKPEDARSVRVRYGKMG